MTQPLETSQIGDLTSLNTSFRQLKHDVNNSLGVMMAMAELAQMNPKNTEKLINIVLDRGPKVVALLQEFTIRLHKFEESQNENPR